MRKKYTGIFALLVLSAWLLSFNSCVEEEQFHSVNTPFEFSTDTIRFDTVFTSVGSTTKLLKIFNTSTTNVLIDQIRFENNHNDNFRMNIDGLFGNEIDNIEIRAKDSLYVFVEVTVDPNMPLSVSPFIIQDKILVRSGGSEQSVRIEAWGQNANYVPFQGASGTVVRLTCDNNVVEWNDPKPYVIYGILLIDSCQLTLAKGSKIYVHGGLAMSENIIYNDGSIIVQKDGKILANGTLDDPVIFQGDRLESSFDNVSGQWAGIRLLPESQGNEFNFTTIKNSVIGIRVDSSASIKINNSKIFNTSSHGLIGIHSDINILNSLLYLNGGSSMFFIYGGDYNITYSTIANYENNQPAVLMNNSFCRDENCELFDINTINAQFTNCIISGSNEDEILQIDDDLSGGSFNIEYRNSLLKVEELLTDEYFLNNTINSIFLESGDSTYVDQSNYDLQLHDLSKARGNALPLENITCDIDGKLRSFTNPSIGCYEPE